MKKIYSFFTVLLLVACSKSEPLESKQGILPTKSITTISDGTFYGSQTYIYDKNKLTNVNFSTREDEDAGNAELKYSEDLLININQYDQNNNLTEIELKYDSNNRLEQYLIYKRDQNMASKVVLEYIAGNTIKLTTFTGGLETQTEMISEMTYTLDSQNNITKIQTANYQIVYEYDSKNGIYKNLVARDVLNLLGRLDGTLNRGGMNNAISYEFSNNVVTDHMDLNYIYNDNSYPTSRVEVSREFGEAFHTEYIYD